MTIDPDAAAAALDDVAGIERRTFQSLIYGGASSILMLWGVLVALGFLVEQFQPRYVGSVWLALNALGLAGTVALMANRKASALSRRLGWAMVALIGFGLIASIVIGGMGPRQLAAFWPCLFMLGYVLAGLWLGRFFILLGIGVTALTVAGFLWLGPWFPLWMAVIEGGALLAGGLWLRRFV